MAKHVPVVAVLNMKGGVGKTTVSAHVSREVFRRYRASTTLIDFDPQFNLTQALVRRPIYEGLKSSGKTIMSAMEPQPGGGLLVVKTSLAPPPPVDEISHRLFYYTKAPHVRLSIVPGDFGLSKFTLIDHGAQLKDVERRFLTFVENAKLVSDYICIDCNPSSSFLTLCVLKASSHIVVPVRADRYSVLGMELLYEFVESIPGLSSKPSFSILLNDVERNAPSTAVELELRGHSTFGSLTLANRMYRSKLLAAGGEYTGFAGDKGGPYSSIVRSDLDQIANEIGQRIGLKEQKL